MTTITGIIKKPAKRIRTDTGQSKALAIVQVETDKRSSYPLRVIGYDLQAIELMMCQYGQRVQVTGTTSFTTGYELELREIVRYQSK